jgi:class 3 adenylate cyclase
VAVDFGTAWSCIDDLTMPSIMVSGFRVVAEAIARRWQTDRGYLVGDPNYGYNLSNFIGDDFDKGTLNLIARNAAQEAEKDERVLRCECVVSLLPDQTLQVVGKVTTAQGPFSLVVGVNNVTVQLLQVSP